MLLKKKVKVKKGEDGVETLKEFRAFLFIKKTALVLANNGYTQLAARFCPSEVSRTQ